MIELPDVSYTSRIADWLELQTIFSGKSLSKNKTISHIEHQVGNVKEEKIDSAFQELLRRLDLYGDTKPYTINNNIIIPEFDWKKYPEYVFCLIFSTHGASDADIGTKLFERLTKECLDHFLGFESIIFGFPSSLSFKKQVDNLANECNEDRGDDPTSFDKDRGVDLVFWKSFNDNRNSHVYVLVQCAAGGKWNTKKQIPLASWRRYISWNHTTTLPALVIAQIIESEKWKNAVDEYGIVIDRARLFRVITSKKFKISSTLKKEIFIWCKSRLN